MHVNNYKNSRTIAQDLLNSIEVGLSVTKTDLERVGDRLPLWEKYNEMLAFISALDFRSLVLRGLRNWEGYNELLAILSEIASDKSLKDQAFVSKTIMKEKKWSGDMPDFVRSENALHGIRYYLPDFPYGGGYIFVNNLHGDAFHHYSVANPRWTQVQHLAEHLDGGFHIISDEKSEVIFF